MRVLARLAILPLGLSFLLGACSDEDPSPVADTRTAWQLCALNASGDCDSSEPAHRQEEMGQRFQVSCRSSAGLWNITITDPGDDTATPQRYRSVLEINNINPNTGDCAVRVREETASGNTIPYIGQCGVNEGCTINVQQAEGDWDFVASLSCSELAPNNAVQGTRFSLYSPPARDEQPVFIAVGNCN